MVAWVCYRSAVSSAFDAGIHIRLAFDLYREELLKQLRIPLPGNQDVEKETWEQVCQFILRGGEISSAYLDTSKPPAAGKGVGP